MGGIVASYLTVNSLVSDRLGSDLLANLIYFTVAILTTLLLLLFSEGTPDLDRFARLNWWMFLGGVASGFCLYCTTLLIGRIGPDTFLVLSVAGQLFISVILAHFGWLGVETEAVSWRKVLGVGLTLSGAILICLKS